MTITDIRATNIFSIGIEDYYRYDHFYVNLDIEDSFSNEVMPADAIDDLVLDILEVISCDVEKHTAKFSFMFESDWMHYDFTLSKIDDNFIKIVRKKTYTSCEDIPKRNEFFDRYCVELENCKLYDEITSKVTVETFYVETEVLKKEVKRFQSSCQTHRGIEHTTMLYELKHQGERICPLPPQWAKVNQALRRQKPEGATEPPAPFILSAWSMRKDVKHQQWLKTIEWAKEHGLYNIIEKLSDEDYIYFDSDKT